MRLLGWLSGPRAVLPLQEVLKSVELLLPKAALAVDPVAGAMERIGEQPTVIDAP